jgi:hypothetical protein
MKSKKSITCTKSKHKKKKRQVAKNIVKVNSDFISIILLCDFPGYRMKSYGLTCLIDINKYYKLIDYQLALINKYFTNCEIIICSGFDADKLQKYITQRYTNKNLRLVENQVFEKTGPCESIRLALNNIANDKVIVLDSNLIFEEKLFDEFISNTSYIFLSEKSGKELEIGVNLNESGNVEYFSYGGHRQWSEIVYLHDKDIIEAFRRIVNNKDYRNKFIFEALNELVKHNFKIGYKNKVVKINKVNNIKIYHQVRKKHEIFNR